MALPVSVGIDSESRDGSTTRLEDALERLAEMGYDGVEVPLDGFNAVRNARVVPEAVARGREILGRYPLRYTMHGPNELNLTRDVPRTSEILESCLEVAAGLGAEVYVYHSGQIALHDVWIGISPPPTAAALQDMWARETEALVPMARRAGDLGITLVVENRDPHRWELAALERWGISAGALTRYHAGMRLDLVAAQAAQIDSPHLGVCLDVGHAYLAAPFWPVPDYLAGVRAAAPWVRHVHLHDNYGRLDDVSTSLADRLMFGEADCHMPPGWGSIPLREVVRILVGAGYAGWLALEMRERYVVHFAEALAAARGLAEAAG